MHDTKQSVTYNWKSKSKNLTWKPIRFLFMKSMVCKTSSESLDLSSTTVHKDPSNSISYTCQKIYSWMRRPATILEIREKTCQAHQQGYLTSNKKWQYKSF